MRAGPTASLRMTRVDLMARGTAMKARRVHGVAMAETAARMKARATRAAYMRRELAAPRTTARVRLPVTVSVGMSRRLFATRSAQAMAPTEMAPSTAVQLR